MRRLRSWFSRLAALFHRENSDRDLAAELESHLQLHIDDNLRAGMSPDEARRQALIKLGGVEQVKESYRDRRSLPWFDSLMQDARFGLRMLRKNPGFTVVAVLTLALGIGANTAIFSVVYAVLLRPLPVPSPNQLVRIWETYPPNGTGSVSVPDFQDWQAQNRFFQGIAGYRTANFDLKGNESPERVSGAQVTPNFFDVMGVQPIIGRGLSQGEGVVGQSHVAVLSAALSNRLFAKNADAIGQTVRLNEQTFTIVGVMPAVFRLPNADVEIWVPFAPTAEQQSRRGLHFLFTVGRLKPGVRLDTAQTQLAAVMHRIAQQFPNDDGDRSVLIKPLGASMVQNVRPALLILLTAVTLVFLTACANVLNLLFTRTEARQREISVRMTLGATRWRLLRQFVVEGFLLAFFGSSLGYLFAFWGTDLLDALKPASLWQTGVIKPDVHVLAYTLLVMVFTLLLLTVCMAFQSSRFHLQEGLKEGSTTHTSGPHRLRIRSALATGQIAASLILLIGALLLVRSFWHLLRVNPGFETDHVVTMQIALPPQVYTPKHPEWMFFEPMLDRVKAIAGVQSAGVITFLPIQDAGMNTGFQIEGTAESEAQAPMAEFRAASSGYFRALGIPLVKGRLFNTSDNATSPPVAVINTALSDQYFPKENPIGHRFRGLGDQWITIVGIVGSTRQYGLAQPAAPEFDIPYAQSSLFPEGIQPFLVQQMSLVVRTASDDPSGVVNAVRSAVLDVDPDQPVFNVQTMDAMVSDSMESRRFNLLLAAAFAFLAVVLAALGVYGVISFVVRQRTAEFGIRMAFGAQRRDVLGVVMRSGIRLAVVGATIGILGAIALTRFLSDLLVGVEAADPLSFVAASLVLLGTLLLACYIPARRAMKIDPMVALRHE